MLAKMDLVGLFDFRKESKILNLQYCLYYLYLHLAVMFLYKNFQQKDYFYLLYLFHLIKGLLSYFNFVYLLHLADKSNWITCYWRYYYLSWDKYFEDKDD